MNKVLIIAEAGVNHNGDMDMACSLIEKAKWAGADIVKFQTFKTELLVTADAKKADYQSRETGSNESQFLMLKKLELNPAAHQTLLEHCAKTGIQFMSTAFDHDSIDLLASFQMPFWKIPSGELTNIPYLRRIASLGKKLILSTGMAVLGEVEQALDVLMQAGASRDDITVLHCTTEYPTPWDQVNLRAMLTIREAFKVAVGYSDHTAGVEVAIAAVAMGATVIEKHFTLDKNLAGPDHKASLEPQELKAMVDSIRHIEIALGDGVKKPTESELKNKIVARKSIVAAKKIEKGQVFLEGSLALKRPGSGLPASFLEHLLGKPARRDYAIDECIEL